MSRSLPAEPESPAIGSFAEVVREHGPLVRRALRRLGVDPAHVDDAAQDVFVVLHRRAAEYDRGRKLENWLWGIARGVASTYRRSDRRRRRLVGALPRESASASPDRELARGQAARILDRFLQDLDPDKCAVFVLADIEGKSGPEIAQRLALNVNTVYARLRAARQSFASAVKQHRAPDARPLFAGWLPAIPWRFSAATVGAAAFAAVLAGPVAPEPATPEVLATHAIIPDARVPAIAPRTVVARRGSEAIAEPVEIVVVEDEETVAIEQAQPRARRRGAWEPTRVVAPVVPVIAAEPEEAPWGDHVVARAVVEHPSLIEVRADFVDALVAVTAGL